MAISEWDGTDYYKGDEGKDGDALLATIAEG